MKKLSARRRHPLAALVVLLIALAATGGLYATFAPTGKAQAEETSQSLAVEEGQKLFRVGCASCHGTGGQGSSDGPSLVGVGAASADFQLSTGRMPLESERANPARGEPAFSPAEIDALVSYVGSLGDGPPVPQVGPGDLARGRELYLRNCASCHSSTGTGAVLPGGRSAPDLFPATPTQVAEAIRVGPGLMPRFPEHALGDREVDDIAAYVQVLGEQQNRGGLALERIGPVAEGAVAFFVAIPLLLIVIRRLGKRAP